MVREVLLDSQHSGIYCGGAVSAWWFGGDGRGQCWLSVVVVIVVWR